MRRDPLLAQRRAVLLSNRDVLCQQILHAVRAELVSSSCIGKDDFAIAALGFLEPDLQSNKRKFTYVKDSVWSASAIGQA
jgi:hypothetical protein